MRAKKKKKCSMIHHSPHPLAGKTVMIRADVKHFQDPDFGGRQLRVEDWWDRVGGKSWTVCVLEGNPACVVYGMRVDGRPMLRDDQVLYGHTSNGLGHLVHISQIEEIADGQA